jgi:hypothetical protein
MHKKLLPVIIFTTMFINILIYIIHIVIISMIFFVKIYTQEFYYYNEIYESGLVKFSQLILKF